MSGFYSVDEIIGDFARIEKPDGSFIDLPLLELPKAVKEGDILVFSSEKGFMLDQTATVERKKKLLEMQNKLFK